MADEAEERNHDTLIRVETKVNQLQADFANHLKHHFAVTIAALSGLLATIATLIAFILKMKGG